MEPQPKSFAGLDCTPRVHESAFIAPSAELIGDVTIGENSSVWYQCVLRGDIHRIEVGANSNLQDGTIVHLSDWFGTVVGDWVTVGHRVLLHACTVRDRVLVGMGAIVMDGVVVGEESIIGAGALVTAGTEIPPGSLVVGAPAKVKRELSPEERSQIRIWAERYVVTSRQYLQRSRR